MIEFLLPERLRAKGGLVDSAVGGGLARGFSDARKLLKVSALLSAPIGLLALLPSVFTLEVYDRVIYRHGMSTLIALLAGVAVAVAIEWMLRRGRSRRLREAGASIDWSLQGALLERMLNQPLRALEERTAAAWMALFRDASAVRVLLTGVIVQSVFDLPVALFALVIIGIVALPVLPVVLLALLVFSVMAWWLADEVKSGKVLELQRARNLDMLTAEVCRARESVKSLAQQTAVIKQWRDNYESWLAESYTKSGEIEESRELSHSMLIITSVAITAFGALAVVNQWMTIGGLIAANMLALKAISPISNLAGAWRQLAHSIEAANRLRGVFEAEVEPGRGELEVPRPNGRVVLDRVTFRFSPELDPIINDVSLSLEPRQFYAIVGRNGAGKSTLLKLLSGLYRPEQGRLLLGDYDLQQFSREETASWIGTLSQNVYFLDGSIADQLRRVAPDATDDQIVRACQLAGAHAFIAKLPRGYNTQLREGGRALSAGERRKIALAQVLLRNPVVLVLDEPTNDLDHESELQLIAALKSIARIRTVLVVTHSARMVANADAALSVIGDGSVLKISTEEALATYFSNVANAAARNTPPAAPVTGAAPVTVTLPTGGARAA